MLSQGAIIAIAVVIGIAKIIFWICVYRYRKGNQPVSDIHCVAPPPYTARAAIKADPDASRYPDLEMGPRAERKQLQTRQKEYKELPGDEAECKELPGFQTDLRELPGSEPMKQAHVSQREY